MNNLAGLQVNSIIADIKASRSYDTTTLPVALREVRNLIRTGPRVDADAAAVA